MYSRIHLKPKKTGDKMSYIANTAPEGGRHIRLNLTTLEATRKSYSRVLRAYARRELETDYFRALIYGLSGLLQFWKTEKELEIEKRIEAIEATLEQKGEAGR